MRGAARPILRAFHRLTTALLWGLVAAAPSGASSPPPGPALQDDLDALALALARAWSAEDLDALAGVMASEGIALHLDGQAHPALEVRQARAAIGDFLNARGVGSARVERARVLGGEHPRGLVELAWTPAPGSLPPPAGYSVFIGLERRPEGWRATEVRVIR